MPTIKLTNAVLDKAQPGDTLYDTLVTGLHARVLARRISFFLYFRTPDKQPRRPKIGDYGILTIDQARTIAREWLAMNAMGKPVKELQPTDAITIRDLYTQWQREHKPHLKPDTQRAQECQWNNYILPALGNHRVAKLDRRPVVDLFKKISLQNPIAANRVLALISKALSLAEEWDIRASNTNPCTTIRHNKENKRERYLTPEELPRLGAVLQAWEARGGWDRKYSRYFRLLIMTGARKNELAKAKREWLNFDMNMLCLPDEASKTGRKNVMIPPAGMNLIRRMIEEEPDSIWLFPGKISGKPLHNPYGAWEQILKEADIKDLLIHDLRHSFASIGLSMLGMDLKSIGGMLGHRDTNSTDRYAHLMQHRMMEISEAIGGAIERLMLPAPLLSEEGDKETGNEAHCEGQENPIRSDVSHPPYETENASYGLQNGTK